jgi:hypothetical protein
MQTVVHSAAEELALAPVPCPSAQTVLGKGNETTIGLINLIGLNPPLW